jgi:hypothetical protein
MQKATHAIISRSEAISWGKHQKVTHDFKELVIGTSRVIWEGRPTVIGTGEATSGQQLHLLPEEEEVCVVASDAAWL